MERDKFIPKLRLRQPGFTYSACGLFPKYYERIRKFRKPGHLNHIYNNELDKACFPHDAAYSGSNYTAHKMKKSLMENFIFCAVLFS